MEVLINDIKSRIENTDKAGREGAIFTTNYNGQTKAIKLYHEEKRTDFTERKIMAFVDRFNCLDLNGIENYIAYPELAVFDSENNSFCGFLMKYFQDCLCLDEVKFDPLKNKYKHEKMDDAEAIDIIQKLFSYTKCLHKAGIVLGDVNPENILLEKNGFQPVIVDFDSAQIGTYYSNTNRTNYIDPAVHTEGQERNMYFIYTTDSDIFALAVIGYEFIVGANPFFFPTSDASGKGSATEWKKKHYLSMLDYFENNKNKTSKFEFDIFYSSTCKYIIERLRYLKKNHSNIYEYFTSVFVNNRREYYLKEDISAVRRIARRSNIEKKELIPQTKVDPDELRIFMGQFSISYE